MYSCCTLFTDVNNKEITYRYILVIDVGQVSVADQRHELPLILVIERNYSAESHILQ